MDYASQLYDEIMESKLYKCYKCKISTYERYLYKCYICNNYLCFNCYDNDENKTLLEYHTFCNGWIIPNEDENQSICDECVKEV